MKRLPTIDEWKWLINNCKWEWDKERKGQVVTSKNGNSIFLPAAGYTDGVSFSRTGSYGFYWSSSIDTDYPRIACYVFFNSDGVYWYDCGRYRGRTIRPVSDTPMEGFVDMGNNLFWAEKNEEGYFTCDEAMKLFNDSDSEDEMIRKNCVHFLELQKGHHADTSEIDECISYLEKQKPNIELIQRSWYMEGYNDRKFGKEPKWVIKTGEGGPKHELNPKYGQPLAEKQTPTEGDKETDIQKAFREGQSVGRQEVFDNPGAYGLEKIDNVFGFRIGDKVRLADGDGRPHIIKHFEKIEGLHGPDFYRVRFEDNTASDHIIPGDKYPNGYFTCMEKIGEQKEQRPIISAEESLGISQEEYNKIVDECIHGEQKELKPVENIVYPHSLDEAIRLYYYTYGNGKGGFDYISLPKFQDIVEEFVKDYGQKHEEWSKEDDVMLDKVFCLIHPGTKLTEDNADYCVELKQWIGSLRERILKSLRPQPVSQPNINHTVWHNASEEKPTRLPIIHIWYHGNRVNTVVAHENIGLQAELGDINFQPDDKWAYVEDLLNVQPHWKPSEEQMEALFLVSNVGAPKHRETLKSLYNDLKKLM